MSKWVTPDLTTLMLQPTLAPRPNQQDEAGRSQIHKAQIRKYQGVVALGTIQNIAAQPGTKRSGQESVGGKNQPEDGSEMGHAEAVAG